MIQTIKKIATQAVESGNPIAFYEAVVTKAPPEIEIRLKSDANLIIPSDLIAIAEHLTKHKRTIKLTSSSVASSMTTQGYSPHTHTIHSLSLNDAEIEFVDELEVDEKVMVASLQGGQSFFILDRFS